MSRTVLINDAHVCTCVRAHTHIRYVVQRSCPVDMDVLQLPVLIMQCSLGVACAKLDKGFRCL